MAREKRQRRLTVMLAALLLAATASGCAYQADICSGLSTYEYTADQMGLDADRAWEVIRGVFRCSNQTAP